jgi:hypothetical protein
MLGSVKQALDNSESYEGEFRILKKFVADHEAQKWQHLQLFVPAINVYMWINRTLAYLVTEADAKQQPLLEYIKLYKQKDEAEGNRIERTYRKMARYWNRFHEAQYGSKQPGNMADECVAAPFEQVGFTDFGVPLCAHVPSCS